MTGGVARRARSRILSLTKARQRRPKGRMDSKKRVMVNRDLSTLKRLAKREGRRI
jgi:hypothetical protein